MSLKINTFREERSCKIFHPKKYFPPHYTSKFNFYLSNLFTICIVFNICVLGMEKKTNTQALPCLSIWSFHMTMTLYT